MDLRPQGHLWTIRWSWSSALAMTGLAGVVGYMLLDPSEASTGLLGGAIALATIGVASHLVGTWRAGRSI